MSSLARRIEKRQMKETSFKKGSAPYPHATEFKAALAKQQEDEE